MKCFLAYKVTGENEKDLIEILSCIREELLKQGIENYSTFLDTKESSNKDALDASEFMKIAFEEIDSSDFMIAILTSNQKSEGLLMEIGYCIAKGIPFLLLKKIEVTETYLDKLTKFCIEWENISILIKSINEYDFESLYETI